MQYLIHLLTFIFGASYTYAATQYQWEVPMLPVPGTGQLPDVTVEGVVSYIYSLGLALGGFFAFIRLVQAGIEWGEAGGNVGSVKEAQDIMKNVAFGLLLLLGAYALLNTINPEIVSPDISFPNNSQSAAQSRTTAATLGGTGNNSVGSSITKLLQSVDIGNVLPDTWTQVQQNLITVQEKERKVLPGTGSCDAVFKNFPAPGRYTSYEGIPKTQKNITSVFFQNKCYSIPYRNASCSINVSAISRAAERAQTFYPGAPAAGANLRRDAPLVEQWAKLYGFNPNFVLAEYLTESAAGGYGNAQKLGCLYAYRDSAQGSASGFIFLSPSSSLCTQMKCMFEKESAIPENFANFACNWALGQKEGCTFGTDDFGNQTQPWLNTLALWYDYLTQYSPAPCKLQFAAPGC